MKEYTKRIGTERKAGTDWPINAFVRGSGHHWLAGTRCNGIDDLVSTHRTRKEAFAWHGDEDMKGWEVTP